jgi:hypothetical protein
MWISEGIAEYLAPTTFGKELRWKGPGEVNDMRMFELEMYLKSVTSDEPDARMIERTVTAGRLSSTGYASAWALTHYVAKEKRTAFQDYLAEVSQMGPFESPGEIVPPGLVPNQLQQFITHFGGDVENLQSSVVNHLKELPYRDPFAEWPHWVAILRSPDGKKEKRQANLFHSPLLANKWLSENIDALPKSKLRAAQGTVQQFANRPLAEQFAREFLNQ